MISSPAPSSAVGPLGWLQVRIAGTHISRRAWSSAAAVAFVGALGLLAPAEHVVGSLLSDSYMTLYAGRWIANHGIPHREVFTIAASGRAWIDQQWLAELTDYEMWKIGGYAGVALLSVAAIGVSYALLAALMLRRGASVVLAICCSAMAILPALPAMFIRAQTFAFPLFAVLLAICLTDSEHDCPQRRLILLLPLLALWANIHGSVLMAAGLAAAYLAYRALNMARRGVWRSAFRCVALAFGALLMPMATPYGSQIVHYYTELLGNRAIAAASPEWRPPTFPSLAFFLFVAILALVLISVTAHLIKRRRLSWPLIGATAATALATALASRNDVWFAMIAALLLADTARTWLPTQVPERMFLAVLAASAVGFAALGVGALATRTSAQYEGLTPLHAISVAAAYAAHHPCDHILADNDAASALLWHDPSLAGRVAFDARLEQYPPQLLYRWITFQAADTKQWARSTNGYQLLIGSSVYDPLLVHRLAHLAGSTVLARDGRGIAVLNAAPTSGCAGSGGLS
jgi:hypothetical protein